MQSESAQLSSALKVNAFFTTSSIWKLESWSLESGRSFYKVEKNLGKSESNALSISDVRITFPMIYISTKQNKRYQVNVENMENPKLLLIDSYDSFTHKYVALFFFFHRYIFITFFLKVQHLSAKKRYPIAWFSSSKTTSSASKICFPIFPTFPQLLLDQDLALRMFPRTLAQ